MKWGMGRWEYRAARPIRMVFDPVGWWGGDGRRSSGGRPDAGVPGFEQGLQIRRTHVFRFEGVERRGEGEAVPDRGQGGRVHFGLTAQHLEGKVPEELEELAGP